MPDADWRRDTHRARRPSTGGLPQDPVGFANGHAHCRIAVAVRLRGKAGKEKEGCCAAASVVDRLEKMARQAER